jgi:hypothetical protein
MEKMYLSLKVPGKQSRRLGKMCARQISLPLSANTLFAVILLGRTVRYLPRIALTWNHM